MSRMSFIAMAMFALRLAVLAIATPVPSGIGGGIAMPLTRRSSLLDANKGIDLAATTAHLASVRGKILRDLDKDTGRMHPFDMKGGEISIGTPAKTFKVEIDTGSSNMFVFQAGCASCEGRNLWDPDTSQTSKYIRDGFKVHYADGAIATGDVYSDNVTIAGYMADPLLFGAATEFSSPIDNNPFVADGMLGLSFTTTSNLFRTLVNQNKVSNPTFSLKLSSSGGELYIGGSNSQLYDGAITYTSLIDPASGLWKVFMDDIRIGDMKLLEDVPVTLDTGANFIFGDWDRVATLYSHIGGKLMDNMYEGFGYYSVPCDSHPTLGFTFGGRSFQIPPDLLINEPIELDGSPHCVGNIVATHLSASYWGVGVPFLRSVYTVFDYGSKKVGFADLA